jgi:outer membrane protein assembly factor BamB
VNASGVSDATNLPVEFGPAKNVIWKTALPAGHSSPVLTTNRIFVTAADADKKRCAAHPRARRNTRPHRNAQR